MQLLWQDRITKDQADIIISRSKDLGTNPDWFMSLSDFESGLNPFKYNPYGCYSWIQFCPDVPGGNYKTINGRRYYFFDMAKMSANELLNLSFDYLEEQKEDHGPFASYHDLYFAILWPDAIGKPDSFIINTKTNDIFDLNKDGIITVGEVKQYLDNRAKTKIGAAYWNTFFKKKNFFQRYKTELLWWGAIVALIIFVIIAYRKIFR